MEVDKVNLSEDNRIKKFKKHGGKQNRNDLVRKMEKVYEFNGVYHLDQLGKNHIIEFYKANRNLSERTMMQYFYALQKLYSLLGRNYLPPKPHVKKCQKRE